MADTETATPPPAGVHEDGSPDRLAIDTIRTLSMDAVQKANSGHPGTPMALAPVGYTIWKDFLRTDPADPQWPNRDRFVLSVGHASMLLYALLHLAKIEEVDADGNKTGKLAIELEDIEQFRQLSSKTPGHPEYRHTTGVETTTGPLGQGCGNSVGMAIAERWLAATYNRPGYTLFDNDTYVLCGDGDMMEGVSAEAASLAGHLKLSNLCWIYDSNHISIEGDTALAFDEDVGARFEAYGWHVLHVDDANDTGALAKALQSFKDTDDRPTFIVVHSVIGWGSPKAGSEKAHGEPLGEDNVRKTKEAYGWPADKFFYVPDGVAEAFSGAIATRGKPLRDEWHAMLDRYRAAYPVEAEQVDALLQDRLPDGWDADIPTFDADEKGIASRDSSGKVLNALVAKVPWLIGGSADLAPSTKTDIKNAASFEANDYAGRNFHFGVREHAMGSVVNGMALSHLHAYGSTFFVFLDYMRAPVRLSAIMELGAVWIYTHDSIGVGEDGPTHQPIEHLATLRAIPGLDTIRPGDANEVAVAWKSDPDGEGSSDSADPVAPGTADARPDQVRQRGWCGQGRVCAGERRRSAGHPDRHRLRGRAGRQGLRAAEGGGRARPRRVDAELVPLREAGRGVQGKRAAEGRDRAGCGGDGRRARLDPLRRHGRQDRHDGYVRRLGPDRQAAGQVRLHRGERGEGGEGIDRLVILTLPRLRRSLTSAPGEGRGPLPKAVEG